MRCTSELNPRNELNTAKAIYGNMYEQAEIVFHSISKDESFDLVSLKSGIKAMVDSVVRNPSAMSLLVQLKKSDEYSYSHALGTSVWCVQFGRHLGLTKKDLNTLALGGMLLDVGKLKMPDDLIYSTNKYGPEERESIKQHVVIGANILKQIPRLGRSVLEMVAVHHERADGSGYLTGVINNKIPLFGRIAGIVDSYDAMTSKRFYINKIFTPYEAMNELYNLRGQLFQAELVEQFIQTVGLYPAGSLVELNTGEDAIITQVNELKRLRPAVMLILDENKLYDEFVMLDLSVVTGVKVVKGFESGAYGINMDELFL